MHLGVFQLKTMFLAMGMVVFLSAGGLLVLVASATLVYEVMDGDFFDGTLLFDEFLNGLLVLSGGMLMKFGLECRRCLTAAKVDATAVRERNHDT